MQIAPVFRRRLICQRKADRIQKKTEIIFPMRAVQQFQRGVRLDVGADYIRSRKK